MIYKDIEVSLLNLVAKEGCPRSFIFYGKNFLEIEKISKRMCLSILGSDSFNLRDMVEFKTSKKIFSVDDIRELNIEISKKPEICDNKVVLIYDSQKMSVEAQNAFLKTLENCYHNVFIIMLCKDLNNILSTIKSRCLVFKFKTMNFNEFSSHFIDDNLSENILKDLYIQTKGDVYKSKCLLNHEGLYEVYNYILDVIEYIASGDLIDIFKVVEQIENYKNDIDIFINGFFEIIRDLIIYNSTLNDEFIDNRLFKNRILEIHNNVSKNILNKLILELNSFKNRIDTNLNLENSYKIMILKVKEV